MTWGYKCDRINKLQKKAIRIVSLSKYSAHTEPIFKRLNLLTVADILKIQELKFYLTRTYHEYAKCCIRHNIPRTINNTTAFITK